MSLLKVIACKCQVLEKYNFGPSVVSCCYFLIFFYFYVTENKLSNIYKIQINLEINRF